MSLLVLIARYYEIKLFAIIGVMNNEEVEELTSWLKNERKYFFWKKIVFLVRIRKCLFGYEVEYQKRMFGTVKRGLTENFHVWLAST